MNQEISETLTIEQDNEHYTLHLNSIGDIISFNLDYNYNNYTKKIPLKEIKDKNSYAIFATMSVNDFIPALKKLSENKKLSLIKKDNNIIIKIEAEIMFINHVVEIELINKIQNLEKIEKELNELKTNYSTLKQENVELKKRIESLETKNENLIEEHKKEINDLKSEINEIKKILNPKNNIINKLKIGNKSVIMKEDEFDLIHSAIKERLNKEVKELIKLYQATVDGGDVSKFHSRCDNIPNTLVLIKSAGNRRFGGFTTAKWSSHTSGEYKEDPNAFLFSLDKQKIYSHKNNGKAIYACSLYGPLFGNYEIYISGNCIKEKKMYISELNNNTWYNYDGDKNALSESGGREICALEYEVFYVRL